MRRLADLTQRLGAGVVAGVVGTVAMDVLLYLRYRRDNGSESLWRWEFAGGVHTWSEASAPGQLGAKVEHVVLRQEPPDGWARATTNVVHWATGIGWGIQYGVFAKALSGHPYLRACGLGPVAWLTSYVILPIAKVYRPIWEYDVCTLRDDLIAHVVYGTATSAAFAAIMRGQS